MKSLCEITQSCPTLCDPMDCRPTRLLHPWNFLGKSTGVGCHFLLQGTFPTQRLNHVSCVSCIARQANQTSFAEELEPEPLAFASFLRLQPHSPGARALPCASGSGQRAEKGNPAGPVMGIPATSLFPALGRNRVFREKHRRSAGCLE